LPGKRPATLANEVNNLASHSDNQSAETPTALPIRIQGLTKKFGQFYALDSVDLEVHSGEFLTLLGPSGSGKTTLLMAIAGFNRPDAGSIRFGEAEMILTPPHRRNVGMVFQSYALFPHMSVAENVAFPLKLRQVNATEIADRVAEALATVQLSDLGDRSIDQLSGGQRQRVALARAFVFRPRILLMDEPLSALDKKLREQMQIELKHLHQKLGVTTVYVTHDQREALTMSRLAQVDTPHVIYNQPANPFVADFIGESTMLPLTRDDSGRFFFESHLISADEPEKAGSDCSLVIRPERLFVIKDQAVDTEQTIVFPGVVRDFVFQGDTAFAVTSISDKHDLAFRFGTDASSSEHSMQPGDQVSLGLNRADVIIIPRATDL
jgi:putative spermidine/putrescine transport system ATP-binding protein